MSTELARHTAATSDPGSYLQKENRRSISCRETKTTTTRTTNSTRCDATQAASGSPTPILSPRRGRSMRWPPLISPRCRLFILFVSLCVIPGGLSLRVVTLDSIDIFTIHEWFTSKPVVYFRCNGEDKIYLPDVKMANLLYTFKGEESWQPLTELPEKKCKRCGLYEEDKFKSDDVFDEWELCSSDFKAGKYTHSKEGQFNATFLCPNCTTAPAADSGIPNSTSEVEAKKTSVVVIIIVSVLASVIVIIALLGVYKYWQKKKRERDQARFLKLFEEGDDIEDELGLGSEL